jgi:hypothetical protein
MKFIITEEEKSRILNMHKNAIKRQYLKEELGDPGTINAQAREQTYVDGGMNYIGFTLYGENNTRKTYYYNCTADFYSSPEEQVGAGKAGAIFDEDGNLKTVAELGLKGDYNTQFKNACQNIYTWIANKRKTFCADPKNKTKKNYGWNCPQPVDNSAQVASAEAEAKAAEQKAAADAAQKAKEDAERQKSAAANAVDAGKMQEFSTKMAEYRTKLTGYESMTQEQLETLINEINAYWKQSLINRSSEDEERYRRLFPKFNTEFKTKFPAITVLLNTK